MTPICLDHSKLANSRKHQRMEQQPVQLNETFQPHSKRQKPSHHSTEFHPVPAFWDNFSKIWLIKHVLRESDERDIQSAPARLVQSPAGHSKHPCWVKDKAPIYTVRHGLSLLSWIEVSEGVLGPRMRDLRGVHEM